MCCVAFLVGTAVGFQFLFYGRWADGKCLWMAKFLRWCHGELYSESLVVLLHLGAGNGLQRLWCSIMRLLADNGVCGEF